MSVESEGRGDTQKALDRLADLLLFPERFTADPRAALEEYGLAGAIPDEVASALSGMSPDELRLIAQVRRRQGLVKIEPEFGIIF